MISQFKTKFNPLLILLAKPFYKINPNVISLGAFIVAIPGFYFFTQGHSLLGSLFIIGAIGDAIDGVVARNTNQKTDFGGVLDATLDRIFDGILLLCIGIGNLVSFELLFATFIASVSISYVKAKAETAYKLDSVGSNRFSVGIAQRPERLILVFLGSILNFFVSPNSNSILQGTILTLLIAGILTLLWRFYVIYRYEKEKKLIH